MAVSVLVRHGFGDQCDLDLCVFGDLMKAAAREADSWQLAAGNWQLASGSWLLEACTGGGTGGFATKRNAMHVPWLHNVDARFSKGRLEPGRWCHSAMMPIRQEKLAGDVAQLTERDRGDAPSMPAMSSLYISSGGRSCGRRISRPDGNRVNPTKRGRRRAGACP